MISKPPVAKIQTIHVYIKNYKLYIYVFGNNKSNTGNNKSNTGNKNSNTGNKESNIGVIKVILETKKK